MDPTLILLVVALGAFIVFQVFQGRKRKRETEERQTRFVPGVEIMTNYGLYGTIIELDDDRNLALIETSPGTVLKIHRQTILKVADYEELAAAAELERQSVDTDDEPVVAETTDLGTETAPDDARSLGTPEFGERIDPKDRPSGTTPSKSDD